MGGGGWGWGVCAFLTHHRTSAAVGVPLPPLPECITPATLAAVRPVDRLTRVQIQSRALQIWLISELLFLMNVWRMEHALFGGSVACVWPALTLSLSLSPRITRCLNACSSARPPLTRRSNILFERATPAYADTHCSNACSSEVRFGALARASACASLHTEVLPAAGAA